MNEKLPYHIVKSRYVTEKATLLEGLQHMTSNRCMSRCDAPKYVFLVDRRANKVEIARAVEAIYVDRRVRVRGVNTINMKPKKRRVRGRNGFCSAYKKAIVTLESGDTIEDIV